MAAKNHRDLWAGLMFIAVGASFAIGALEYRFGTSVRPGPAYFPFGLGILLAAIGVLVALQGLLVRGDDDGRIGRFAWRPLGVVIGAILVFAVTLPWAGMLVALPLLVAIISAAADEYRWRDVLLNAALLTAGSWAIFIWGLGLTLPVWPAFMD